MFTMMAGQSNVYIWHRFILAYTCLLSSVRCTAIDPWPTINSSPLFSTNLNHNIRPSSSQVVNACRCKFFLWDIISYIKFCETNREIRENSFEGLRGRKFVRVQPGSLLEKWLPQMRRGRLKKDGCVLCGYSFRDHLEYWSNCRQKVKGVSAFDRYLDTASSGKMNKGGHAFYRQYVEEVSPNTKRKRKGKLIRESDVVNVAYLVPAFNPLADGNPKKPWTVFMLLFARNAALERVDDLIWFGEVESSGIIGRSVTS
jgi:hypothetical protein